MVQEKVAQMSSGEKSGRILEVNEQEIQQRLDQVVVGTVEDTINQLLEAEADRLCHAHRYGRTEGRSNSHIFILIPGEDQPQLS